MSLLLRTDVTSVKIHKNLVLAGIGGFLNVFDKGSNALLQKWLCLNGQKIYGIVPSENGDKILVFGGKQFTLLTCTGLDDVSDLIASSIEPVECDDWLHSVVWIDETNIALLTAHNVVQKWDINNISLTSKHCSKDNSILYSGLLLSLSEEVLVMAGTVFSEVIVHVTSDEEPLFRLKRQKGVIFSISCNPEKGMIITTSDNRSVTLWAPTTPLEYSGNTIDYWRNVEMVCIYELYGHTARVMRSCITADKIISAGEDAAICVWNYDGYIVKKFFSHHNGCIWSVDADKDVLVTGGGDCAVILQPITLPTDYRENETLNLDIDTPKKVIFTARRNIAILNERNELIYYDVEERTKQAYELNHDSTFKLMSVSSCKQMVAVADKNGKLDVFAETCGDTACLVKLVDTKLAINKVLSMQWAGNRHLVICSDNGDITVLASKDSSAETFAHFTLPSCKERWLTASAIDNSKNILVVGDRCGNVHIYDKDHKDPIKSFNKVHGRYGPTSITIKDNEVVTTGRDGTVKYFSVDTDKVNLLCTKHLDFKWVEKFLDKDQSIVCGFQERVFVVYNLKRNSRLLKIPCGGGHRSWDAVRYFEKLNDSYEEVIKLIYLKNADINIVKFQLNKMLSKHIINSSHSKEINCLKTYSFESVTFFISGGEDTTLRVSSASESSAFEDQVIFKHLSNIRTLKICHLNHNSILVISAGGRAQICIKNLSFVKINNEVKVKAQDLIDYMIKGTDKMRKGNQNWRNCSVDFDPEMRIMDVDYIKTGDKYVIFAGCSDASLRIFTFDGNLDEPKFVLNNDLKYHKTCILKTCCIKIDDKDILVTCTSRGEVAFWNINEIDNDNEPFYVMKTNKSGINSFVSKTLTNDRLLIVTAGDDNAMHLVLLQLPDVANLSSIKVLNTKVFDKYHSSEITGLFMAGNNILSTSIDQRITVFNWGVINDEIECTFVSQTYSHVADIQGMDVIEHSSDSTTACVFGKGLEIIRIPYINK